MIKLRMEMGNVSKRQQPDQRNRHIYWTAVHLEHDRKGIFFEVMLGQFLI